MEKNYSDARIKVYDISGKKINEQDFQNINFIKYQLKAKQGLYFLVIETEGEILGQFKIIKERI